MRRLVSSLVATDVCKAGHMGVFCGVCQPNHVKNSAGLCEKCSDDPVARSLALASSSLSVANGVLLDSPNLRHVYSFAEACPEPPRRACGTTLEGSPVREWCVAPRGGGAYSPLTDWRNTDGQQLEMLLWRNVSEPTLACTVPS